MTAEYNAGPISGIPVVSCRSGSPFRGGEQLGEQPACPDPPCM